MRFLKLLFATSIIAVSCTVTETEYIEVPVVEETVIISIIDSSGFFGASGYLNDSYKEFQSCGYHIDSDGNIGLQIGRFEWFANSNWAARDIIGIRDIPSEIVVDDTIQIDDQSVIGRLFHVYADGDAFGECYEILDDGASRSWVVFTRYNESTGTVKGALQAHFVISDLCPEKVDPSQPDTIVIRDFVFQAKKLN